MLIKEKRREWYWDQDELSELVENQVNERNEITIDELAALLPEIEDNPQRLESLLVNLANMGVAVIANPEIDVEDEPEPSRGTGYFTGAAAHSQ